MTSMAEETSPPAATIADATPGTRGSAPTAATAAGDDGGEGCMQIKKSSPSVTARANEAVPSESGTTAAATVTAAEAENIASSAPKISISFKKKSSKPSSKRKFNAVRAGLAEEYSTIAEEARVISERRKDEGTVLVIPCKQGRKEEEKRRQPLLAGRLALLGRQGGEGDAPTAVDTKEQAAKDSKEGAAETQAGTSIVESSKNEDTNPVTKAGDSTLDEEDEAIQQLILSAKQNDPDNIEAPSLAPSGSGLVIAAPSQNNRMTRGGNDPNNDDAPNNREITDEERQFKQELAHHAPDVDPTSNVYADVAVSDFGSALLRGMGWTGGGPSARAGDASARDETIKRRPHRLGLGATPLIPPSASARPSGSGGIHRRARRPDEVKRDEERRRQREEAERREEERKRLDVQRTMQRGSIVRVVQEDDGRLGDEKRQRAAVIQTSGVPGLNRILIQMEDATEAISVTRRSVVMCSWQELKRAPFQRKPLERKEKRALPSPRREDVSRTKRENIAPFARKRNASYSSGEREDGRGRDYKRRDRSSDFDQHSEDSRSRPPKEHKGRKKHRRDRDYDRRSRNQSESRERSRRRPDESSYNCSHDDVRHRSKDHKQPRNLRCSRSAGDHSSSHRKQSKRGHRSQHSIHDSQSSNSHHPQQPSHWLVPGIRVRLVSKKLPKYHLQKGVVQDVLRTSSGSSGPKAVLLMDVDRAVLDRVPERYLETALPKAGGNVIILEHREHRWKRGRLMERTSSDDDGGYGIVQLDEDLEVVRVPLDGLAEWCGGQEYSDR